MQKKWNARYDRIFGMNKWKVGLYTQIMKWTNVLLHPKLYTSLLYSKQKQQYVQIHGFIYS